MDYKISVVIRTYNEEKHIGEVLKSLNKQTYSNFEVIILDSQSTDNTIKIAQNYDVRIEQIEKKEFNYSFASNKCVEYATGEIVCFLSGHSVPKRNNYLEIANEVFQNKRIGGCRTPGSQKYDHRKSDVLSGSKVLHHLRSRYQKHIAYV